MVNTVKYCKEEGITGYFACTKDTDEALTKLGINIYKNEDIATHLQPSCVIGTTAWGFARSDLENAFDYLFIDEAGQVSVANLIAMSRSTKNIILMGDQMQLGQPSDCLIAQARNERGGRSKLKGEITPESTLLVAIKVLTA